MDYEDFMGRLKSFAGIREADPQQPDPAVQQQASTDPQAEPEGELADFEVGDDYDLRVSELVGWAESLGKASEVADVFDRAQGIARSLAYILNYLGDRSRSENVRNLAKKFDNVARVRAR
jgi:hypothetical protein